MNQPACTPQKKSPRAFLTTFAARAAALAVLCAASAAHAAVVNVSFGGFVTQVSDGLNLPDGLDIADFLDPDDLVTGDMPGVDKQGAGIEFHAVGPATTAFSTDLYGVIDIAGTVPEPASLALVAVAAAGAVGAGRRRRAEHVPDIVQ